MCLGVPGKVLEVDGLVAVVDFWGLRRPILLDLADEPVRPGDYILNHVGFAIRRIPPEESRGNARALRAASGREGRGHHGCGRPRRDQGRDWK